MSGGSYDYAYSKVDGVDAWADLLIEMARDIRGWLARPERAVKYVDAQHEYVPFTESDRGHAEAAAARLEAVAVKVREGAVALQGVRDLMQDVEWIASGDSGLDALLREEG